MKLSIKQIFNSLQASYVPTKKVEPNRIATQVAPAVENTETPPSQASKPLFSPVKEVTFNETETEQRLRSSFVSW